jgi:hypothetical protein
MLLVVTSATVGTSPSLLQNLGYDPRKDFDPIGLIAATPNLIAVHPSFPARSLAELIKVGKETATPIPYGSPGVGTLNHLTVELLAYRTGMKLAHVPYKGAGPALNDLLGGHIGVLISAVPNAHSHVLAGTIHSAGRDRRQALRAPSGGADLRRGGICGLRRAAAMGSGSAGRHARARSSRSSTRRSMQRSPVTTFAAGSPSRAPSRNRAARKSLPPSSTARSRCGRIS